MAEHNAQTVKAQIQSLINKANETTGNTDTNLTDGVNALVEGFGQGGSGSSGWNEVIISSVIGAKIEPQKRTILRQINLNDYVTSSVTV